MDGWMDGWMEGWMDGWMDRRMDGWIDRWIDGWIERLVGISIENEWKKTGTWAKMKTNIRDKSNENVL